MTEDTFVDASVELCDDFSLASSIDDINYDDPFNHHEHITSDFVPSNSLQNENITGQSPISETDFRGMTACTDASPIRDKEKMIEVCNRYHQRLSSLSRYQEPIKDIGVNPNRTSGLVRNGNDPIGSAKQPRYFMPKTQSLAIKVQKTSAKSMLKLSKSDGLLTLALKAKYRKSTFQQRGNTSYAMNGTGGEDTPALGGANASWNNTSGSQSYINGINDGLNRRRCSLPSGKASSMHDLLRQSKAKCKSQFLLRQSSASSLSKRNSFQSIKYVSEKLDVSSLLPAKQYSKSRSASFGWAFPGVATATTKAKFTQNLTCANEVRSQQSTNDAMSSTTDSLLHDACRLFPNSETVVETALRVDPGSVRRSIVFTSDGDLDNHIYGYPINLALTHGANEMILKLLVKSGPDVLALKDGSDCGASLGILLSTKSCTSAIVELLLSANDKCAQIADRRGNYPLHVAVSYGRPIGIVMRLYDAYPQAQGMRNFHSQTPLDIAIQSSRCPENVIDFLRSASCCTSSAGHSIKNTKKPDAILPVGSLEEGLDDIMKINC